ncbi:MAG: hypothetical protein WCY74_03930 [Sphaerochaetaceae bacterium]
MKLHLQQRITYHRAVEHVPQCDMMFDRMTKTLDRCPVGSEGILVIESELTDELCLLSCTGAAYRLPSETEPHILSIEAGSHLFLQLAFAPANGAALIPLLNRFAMTPDYRKGTTRRMFLRLYKEKQFEIAIQCIAPIDTTAE